MKQGHGNNEMNHGIRLIRALKIQAFQEVQNVRFFKNLKIVRNHEK